MELRAQTEYWLVGGGGIMIGLLLFLQVAHAGNKIAETRADISAAERQQRESLSSLFVINKNIKQIAKKRARLNEKVLEKEASVRVAAQEVQDLEVRSERHQGMLNKRLRQLYQHRQGDQLQWLFSAKSPVELERNHRFLKRMIDSDHQHLRSYFTQLRELRQKRNQLRGLVAGLSRMQKDVQTQEQALAQQMRQKAQAVAELKKVKNDKLSELKNLRADPQDQLMEYAFFERKGSLPAPIEAPLARDYGAYVDPHFRFKLMHKGHFYSASQPRPVVAIFDGTVVLAGALPGYGKSVIIDHGDNYYSVYAFATDVKVKTGAEVREGDLLAISGGSSPLFGPGLYFEIRHFTDAIDPRSWIKEPIKTAQRSRSDSWDDVSSTAGR